MCGIVGYIGDKDVTPILVEGLKRLEYRGYDSAGIAVNDGSNIQLVKEVGKLKFLEAEIASNPPKGKAGIGHTRWATHGRPSDVNSHPHADCSEKFVVVHNGIIENFQSLKDMLVQQGHSFKSETDTEVVAHLIEEDYNGDLKETVLRVIKKLEGSFALVIMAQDELGKIVVVRKDSPLIIGKGQGENFIASDIPAYLKYTRQFYILNDGELAEVTLDEINIYNSNGQKIGKELFTVDWDPEMAEKEGYQHFMLKEINEQPDALRHLLSNRISDEGVILKEIGLTREELTQFRKINIVACGTAYHSGLIGKYVIEELARIPVEVDVASEFRYRKPLLDGGSLVIVVSQSGETADTLAALRLAQQKGAKVLALINVAGSSIAREADEVLALHAGPEIAVASTKAFTNMVAAFYLLAIYFAQARNTISRALKESLLHDMQKLPLLAARTIKDCEEQIKKRAEEYSRKEDAFFIGRNIDFTLALEGALKLKEISYIHAEAYPAGELKHGTLALIEEGVPVVALATRLEVFEKMLSNIKEIKARGADVTAIVFENNQEISQSVNHVIYIPKINELLSGVLAIIPLQLLAYYTAVVRDCDIDQPRNLAKSVTVE